MPRRPSIGPLELQILEFVGEREGITTVEAARHFAVTQGYARSTIVTVMNRLCKKRYLTRKKVGGVYRYSARVQNSELQQSLVHDFVHRTLRGSVSPFVAYLAKHGELDDHELDELAQLVEELRGQREESKE